MPDAEPASILDASALIAFLHDEAGSDAVLDAIAQTAAVSIVNWAEALSKVAADGADPQAVAADFEGTLILEHQPRPIASRSLCSARSRKPAGSRSQTAPASHSPNASTSPPSRPTAIGPTSTSASPFSSSAEHAHVVRVGVVGTHRPSEI